MSAWTTHKAGNCPRGCFYCQQKKNEGKSDMKWIKVNGGGPVSKRDKFLGKKNG